jgi:hypothetical protein
MRFLRGDNHRLIRAMGYVSKLQTDDEKSARIKEFLRELAKTKYSENHNGHQNEEWPDYVCLDKSFGAVDTRYICRSGFLLREIPLVFTK